jgi:hypothetical protein
VLSSKLPHLSWEEIHWQPERQHHHRPEKYNIKDKNFYHFAKEDRGIH